MSLAAFCTARYRERPVGGLATIDLGVGAWRTSGLVQRMVWHGLDFYWSDELTLGMP